MTKSYLLPLLVLSLMANPVWGDEEKRPNVLVICIDDLRPEMKCYGADHMLTPHMDRLAGKGVAFDRCYVQVAVCNPSRASTWTGLRPNRLGVWTLSVHFRESMPNALTLPQHLRDSGYAAEGYGKVFHNPWPDPRSWDKPHQWGGKSYTNYSPEQKTFHENKRKTFPEGSRIREILRGVITNDPDIPDEQHSDGALTLKAINRLKALGSKDKPFLLMVGYTLPHLPWAPPKNWWDKYDRATIPMPTNPAPPEGAPEVALGTNYELSHYADMTHMPTPASGTLPEEETRRLRHAYFASVSFIDAQVGKLLDAIESQNLDEDTIVVLWSDHGYKLGEHNGWSKMTNYEIDTRIPFIIYDPRAKANGKRCNRLVESLDLFPTICELTSSPVPESLQGKSAAHLLDNPEANHIDAAFSQYIWKPLIGNAIRTDRWRYVEWREMKDGTVRHRELYDHESDPGENQNVVSDHPKIVAQLEKKLQTVLPSKKITLLPRIHSAKGGEEIKFNWKNSYDGALKLSWINTRGERAETINLKKGDTHDGSTTVGQVIVIESIDGKYHEIVSIDADTRKLNLGSIKSDAGLQ